MNNMLKSLFFTKPELTLFQYSVAALYIFTMWGLHEMHYTNLAVNILGVLVFWGLFYWGMYLKK